MKTLKLSLFRRVCLLLLLAAFALPVLAQDASELPDGKDVKGAVDHPLVQRFEGSSIRYYNKKAFDELIIAAGPYRSGEKQKLLAAEGARTTLVYVLPKDVSVLEAIRAYQNEFAKNGKVEILYQGINAGGRQDLDNGVNDFIMHVYGGDDPQSRWMNWNSEYRYVAMRIRRPEGNLYMTVYAGFNTDTAGNDTRTVPASRVSVRIDIIEPKPMAARMVTVTSGEMSAEINKNGRIALYGILFDTAKADVKPESKDSLAEIAKLMKADPKLRLMVVGHTDTQGLFEPNRDLSTRRAKAVVLALTTQYGVDATRLQSFGASFAAPVASNASEAGRAKNRRVELVAY